MLQIEVAQSEPRRPPARYPLPPPSLRWQRRRKALFGKSRNIFRESSEGRSEESPEWKREKGERERDGMVVESSGFEEMETNITLLAAESGGDTDLEWGM